VLGLLLVRTLSLLWLIQLQLVLLQVANLTQSLCFPPFLCCQPVALQIGLTDLGGVSTQPIAGYDGIPETLSCTQLGQLPPAADTASNIVAEAALHKDLVKADIVGCDGAN